MKYLFILLTFIICQSTFSQSFKKGDAVQVLWKEKWYPGKIEEVKGDKFLISYDGYDASWNETVAAERLKVGTVNNTVLTTNNSSDNTSSTNKTYWSFKSVESIYDLALSPDGKYVLAASSYGNMKILNAADLTLVSEIKLTDGPPIFSASWSHDGNYIATGYSDGNALVYVRTEGMQFTIFDTLEGYASIADVRFNPKKLELLVSGAPIKDYTLAKVDVWDIKAKKIKVKIIDVDTWGTSPTSITYSDDGTKIGISYAYDRKGIEVFDSTGKIINKIKHTVEVDCLDFSPDGGMIVSGGIDKSVTLWNLTTNKAVWSKPWYPSASDYVHSVDFSPDGLIIAACGRGSGAPVKIYSFESGAVKHELGTTNPVGNSVLFSSDSKYVYVALTTYGDISKVPVISKYQVPEK